MGQYHWGPVYEGYAELKCMNCWRQDYEMKREAEVWAGCERERVPGIRSKAGRFKIWEVLEEEEWELIWDIDESVIKKLVLVEAGGADGEVEEEGWESRLRVKVKKRVLMRYMLEFYFKIWEEI